MAKWIASQLWTPDFSKQNMFHKYFSLTSCLLGRACFWWLGCWNYWWSHEETFMSKGFHSWWVPTDSCSGTEGIRFVLLLIVQPIKIFFFRQCSYVLNYTVYFRVHNIFLQLDEMLEKKGTKVDKVLNFAIDDSILEERITGRWIHPSSGRSYHTKFAPPKVPGVDDVSWIQKYGLNNYYTFQIYFILRGFLVQQFNCWIFFPIYLVQFFRRSS